MPKIRSKSHIIYFSGGYLDRLFIKFKVFDRFIYNCETEKCVVRILLESVVWGGTSQCSGDEPPLRMPIKPRW